MANDSMIVYSEGYDSDKRLSECEDTISNRTSSTCSASNLSVLNPNYELNQGSSFGDVQVIDCSDVLVGNKVGITGDVTINQFIYPNSVEEKYPDTNNLPIPKDVILKSKNGGVSLKNGPKSHPIVQITQQQSLVSEKGLAQEWWKWMSCSVAGALLVTVLIFTFFIYLRNDLSNDPGIHNDEQYPFYIPDNLTDDDGVPLNTLLTIVQREDWSASSPQEHADLLEFPIPYVAIHHTVTTQCFRKYDCMKLMRSIQEFHFSKDYGDIGYNFLISGDGYIYVGRSWEYMGAHTYPFNRCSFGIAMIGTFTEEEPTEEQMNALKLLLMVGVKMGKLSNNYKLYAGKTLIGGESPGGNVERIIKNWTHYSTDDIDSKSCRKRTDLHNSTATNISIHSLYS